MTSAVTITVTITVTSVLTIALTITTVESSISISTLVLELLDTFRHELDGPAFVHVHALKDRAVGLEEVLLLLWSVEAGRVVSESSIDLTDVGLATSRFHDESGSGSKIWRLSRLVISLPSNEPVVRVASRSALRVEVIPACDEGSVVCLLSLHNLTSRGPVLVDDLISDLSPGDDLSALSSESESKKLQDLLVFRNLAPQLIDDRNREKANHVGPVEDEVFDGSREFFHLSHFQEDSRGISQPNLKTDDRAEGIDLGTRVSQKGHRGQLIGVVWDSMFVGEDSESWPETWDERIECILERDREWSSSDDDSREEIDDDEDSKAEQFDDEESDNREDNPDDSTNKFLDDTDSEIEGHEDRVIQSLVPILLGDKVGSIREKCSNERDKSRDSSADDDESDDDEDEDDVELTATSKVEEKREALLDDFTKKQTCLIDVHVNECDFNE